MRIVRIEARTVWVDLVKPYVTADYKGGGMAGKPVVILRLYTEDGSCGLGEADPYPTFTYESPEAVMQMIRDHLGPAVLGMDPANAARLHVKMDAALPGWPFAKAPIDVAAYDLQAQALGVPVHKLLGGQVRDRIPMIWPIGGGTPEENARESRLMVQEGFGSLHVKLGALTPEEDIARLAAIRRAVGDHIPLMVDVNQGWDRATAVRTIRKLTQFNLSIIEQPVPAWDMTGMAKIQAETDTPISADESLHSLQDGMNLIRQDAARIFSLKTGKCGGLFRTRQVAAMAEAAGMPCFVNSMIEMGISVAASLHLAACVPNLAKIGHALMSNLRIKEDILEEGSFHYDGKDILVPQACAGLGVVVDEAKLAARTIDQFELVL